MWLFTNTGFVSAVKNGDKLKVRARDERSLYPLVKFAGVKVVKTPYADYPYRVEVTNEVFAGWVSQLATEIDYHNFKSEVGAKRGYNYAHPLTQVWSIMHDVEDGNARKQEWEIS